MPAVRALGFDGTITIQQCREEPSSAQAARLEIGTKKLMAKFTAPDGSKVTIDAARVIRIREAVSGENTGENAGAKTRVDWTIVSLVKEPIEQVVSLVQTKLTSLAVLSALEGKKIWFDAKQAVGPLPITRTQKNSGFNSSIKIMGYRQYVTEAPDKVRAVIAAAGGNPVEDN